MAKTTTINPLRSMAIMMLAANGGLMVTPAEAAAAGVQLAPLGNGTTGNPKGATVAQQLPPAVSDRPGVTYHTCKSIDAKLVKAQTGKVATVFAAVKAAKAKGIRASEIAAAHQLKDKTVQSALWHLRKSGLVESKPIAS